MSIKGDSKIPVVVPPSFCPTIPFILIINLKPGGSLSHVLIVVIVILVAGVVVVVKV